MARDRDLSSIVGYAQAFLDKIPLLDTVRSDLSKDVSAIISHYLELLEQSEDRFPNDIAIGAVFCACFTNHIGLSPIDIERQARYPFTGWYGVAEDMIGKLGLQNGSKS